MPPKELDNHWRAIDELVVALPTNQIQEQAWQRIVLMRESGGLSRGHPFFRLGVHHLQNDEDESRALQFLEQAYQEDEKFHSNSQLPPHRKGAYRLLSITKGFLDYLQNEGNPWEKQQLNPPQRETLITTLLIVYDKSLIPILDSPTLTYLTFQALIKNPQFVRFAIENYNCGIHLIEAFVHNDTHINTHSDEYPLARAVVGLFAGVIEAVLLDRIPHSGAKPLGTLITIGYEKGLIEPGTKLGTLCSMMNYLRKHVHPDRDAKREDYFIDINVARGTKAALELALIEILNRSS